MEFTVYCGPPTGANLTIAPATIESDPAPFNSSHSLIRIELTSGGNGPVLPFTEVQINVDRCELSDQIDTQNLRDQAVDLFDQEPLLEYVALALFADSFPQVGQSLSLTAFDVDSNDDTIPDHSEVLAILHAEECAAGPVIVTIEVEILGGSDIEETVTITVVGPPVFIAVTAAPTELVCGEKAEINVSATDALNQGVSDFTEIEVVTNYGGVLGGTGATIDGSGGPVTPLSSTTVRLIDGAGIAYLLTSEKHIGTYEVLAAYRANEAGPVASQATVTCTPFQQTEVIAPDTGTGAIRPPNTGEAGLAAGGGSGSLIAIAGAGFIALALIARRFAR
jgi:hypothetical protein